MSSTVKTLRLQWVGAEPGYCRTYFKDEVSGDFYTLTEDRNTRIWHTTDCIDGEPDMPLNDGTIIELIQDGQVFSKEIISCVDGNCDSVGVPIADDFNS